MTILIAFYQNHYRNFKHWIARHKVFEGLAALGKTSVDWFYGFKLHIVVNELGQL